MKIPFVVCAELRALRCVGLVLTSFLGAMAGLWMLSLPSTLLALSGLALLVIICVPWVVWAAKTFRGFLPCAVVSMIVAVVGCMRVSPGNVGIKVNNLGTDRGVQGYTMTTGLVFYMPGMTQVFEYPTYVQTALWSHSPHEGRKTNDEIAFNSREGLVITADVSLSYRLLPDKIPAFYVKFRSDDLEAFTFGFLRNVARDAFNEAAVDYTVEQLYGDKKEEFLRLVQSRVNTKMETYGVVLEQFGFVGPPRPPDNVLQSINAKIKAIQDAIRVENEVRQAKAEAQKTIATAQGEAQSRVIRAEGEAKANVLLSQSLTSPLLEWQRLAVTSRAVEKWNGVRPTVEGSGSGLLLNITPNR